VSNHNDRPEGQTAFQVCVNMLGDSCLPVWYGGPVPLANEHGQEMLGLIDQAEKVMEEMYAKLHHNPNFLGVYMLVHDFLPQHETWTRSVKNVPDFHTRLAAAYPGATKRVRQKPSDN
jgi:hypothetical protein